MKVKRTVNTVYTHKLLNKIYHRGVSPINWDSTTDDISLMFRLKSYNPADADDYPGMIVFDTDSKVIRLNGDPYPDIESFNIYYEDPSVIPSTNLFKHIPKFYLKAVVNGDDTLFRILDYACSTEELKNTFGIAELTLGNQGWEINGNLISGDLQYSIPVGNALTAKSRATVSISGGAYEPSALYGGLGYLESYNEVATAKAISGLLDVEYPTPSLYTVSITPTFDALTNKLLWIFTSSDPNVEPAKIDDLEDVGLKWVKDISQVSTVNISVYINDTYCNSVGCTCVTDSNYDFVIDGTTTQQSMLDAGLDYISSYTTLYYDSFEDKWHVRLCEDECGYGHPDDINTDFGITLTQLSDIADYTFLIDCTKMPEIESGEGNGELFLADDMSWKDPVTVTCPHNQADYGLLVIVGYVNNLKLDFTMPTAALTQFTEVQPLGNFEYLSLHTVNPYNVAYYITDASDTFTLDLTAIRLGNINYVSFINSTNVDKTIQITKEAVPIPENFIGATTFTLKAGLALTITLMKTGSYVIVSSLNAINEWIGTQAEYDALVLAGLDGNYQNIYIIET